MLQFPNTLSKCSNFILLKPYLAPQLIVCIIVVADGKVDGYFGCFSYNTPFTVLWTT